MIELFIRFFVHFVCSRMAILQSGLARNYAASCGSRRKVRFVVGVFEIL
jgi:hypothetical protein